MTTEDDFQAALDAHPDDWQTRLVFADWLEERGDSKVEGYRALASLQVQPFRHKTITVWTFHNGAGTHVNSLRKVHRKHALPQDWIDAIIGFSGSYWAHGIALGKYTPMGTRREAEDAAARAFAKLPAERRAELLSVGVLK